MTTRTAKKPPDEPQAVIVPPPGGARSTMTPEQVELIKRTICQSATDDELQLFLLQCARTGLDPFSRQIHAVKRWSNKDGREVMTIQVGIDGYRLIADRTGLYAGNDDPVFDDEAQPQKATVTVWKVVGGVRCPFTASARWAQYYPGDKHGFMWKKMPHLMLGKVAEALALRKAFPAELSGLYTRDELPEEASEPTPPITAPVIAAAPKTDGVHVDPASHVESAPPKADFYAGLMEYDRTLTGRGLIRAGALIAHVAAEGKRAGFPADLTKWTPDHAAAAREWTKAFVRDLPQPAVA